MKHRKPINSKPISRELRVFIPPNTCRIPRTENASREKNADGVDMVLPEGSLEAWWHRQTTTEKFSDQDLGRFARQLVRTDQRVDSVIRALVAADEGMYPPPESLPSDPGKPIEEDGDRGGKGIIPIKDNELGVVRPVFDQIAQELPYRGREEAGLLFGPRETQIGTLFVRDKLGTKTASSFTLHTATLNEVIQGAKQWELDLRFYHIFLFLFDDIRSQEHCL